MTGKRLDRLLEIARLKRDLELAALSVLSAKRQALRAERQGLLLQERMARVEGSASPADACQAEHFSRWAERLAEVLRAEDAALGPHIAAQTENARTAVGRERNLEEIADRLAQARRAQQAKKL